MAARQTLPSPNQLALFLGEESEKTTHPDTQVTSTKINPTSGEEIEITEDYKQSVPYWER